MIKSSIVVFILVKDAVLTVFDEPKLAANCFIRVILAMTVLKASSTFLT